MKLNIAIAAAVMFTGATVAHAQSFATGQWVLAQVDDGSLHFYPGVVTSATRSSVTIAFDDGTTETQPVSKVKPYNWRAGSRITCLWAQDKKLYPAIITRMGSDGSTIGIRYTDDGTTATVGTGTCYSD